MDENALSSFLADRERHKSALSRQACNGTVYHMLGQLQQILNAVDDGIVGLDERGVTTYVNPAAAYILGYSVEELLTCDFHDWRKEAAHDSCSHANVCPICDTLATGATYVVNDEIFCRKDGGHFPAEYNSTPILESGVIVGAVVTFRDITLRKVAESKLRQYMDLLDRAQRFAHLGSWEREICTGNGYWSDETYRIFGLVPQSGIHIDRFLQLIHPDDVARLKLALAGVEHGTAYEERYRIVLPDGQERIVWSKGEPVWEDGRVVRAFGIIQDITEQERVKRQLQDSEELLRRSDQLSVAGQLAAGLAHEIRNPLTALKGFAQLLQRASGPRERHYVDIMQDELLRIERITNELLLLAKPHAVTHTRVDLAQLLNEASELLLGQALLHNVRMTVDVNPVPPVQGDPSQLKQVLINVMKNAIEAMAAGGELRILLFVAQSQVHVSVQDEGGGMTADAVKRLGEPFFTTKTDGTGLGLMVCRRILADHGGALHVFSELGKGTCVELCLPCLQDD